MSLRPFLCHARADRTRLEALKAELSVAGADGWQDLEDLCLGRPNAAEIRRVIRQEAGGFIWFGTPASVASRFIQRIEIPAALARAGDEPFPLVPLFADISPSDLRSPRIGWPRWRASLVRMKEHNGVLRQVDETDSDLWRRTAAGYVRHAVLARGAGPARVCISCATAPDRSNEIVADWRGLVGPNRSLQAEDLGRARDGLAGLREAFQEAGVGRVELAADLYLPLALLVGHEWNILTRLVVDVAQRTGAETVRVSSGMLGADCEVSVERRLRLGRGPVLVAVSSPAPVDGAAERYANLIDAQEVVRFHADRLLSPPEIAGLGRRVAALLGELSDQGRDKHLVLRGPVSLAVMIGAAGNAMGRTCVPLWDQSNGYRPGPVVGDGALELQSVL